MRYRKAEEDEFIRLAFRAAAFSYMHEPLAVLGASGSRLRARRGRY
jgi:hypothetical protein